MSNLVTASQWTANRLQSVTGLKADGCSSLSSILRIDEYADGFAVELECPVCDDGYTADRVCHECFGSGSVVASDLEEVAEMLGLLHS